MNDAFEGMTPADIYRSGYLTAASKEYERGYSDGYRDRSMPFRQRWTPGDEHYDPPARRSATP